jgi:predicted NBD/HSP70 family sugar kinase
MSVGYCALRGLHENRLARPVAHVINILDPEVIVLGGGMSNIERLYKNAPKTWGRWVLSDRVDSRLVKRQIGDSAVCSGRRGCNRSNVAKTG